MNILVIDGQGGGMGKSLIEKLKAAMPDCYIIAVGTNALATAAMLKAGADAGATGENAVIYNCALANIIAGPTGILLANSMFGELTPAMAAAVSSSPAQKVLIPVNRCRLHVAGVPELSPSQYLSDAVRMITVLAGELIPPIA